MTMDSQKLDSTKLKKLYIEFFKENGHKEIPNVSLVPEHDPTVLFTTAGMHPLVPFLLGQPHPSGKRLVNVQKCLRMDDIEEVGDNSHLTFFEMLGNWSLGDYFKKDTIRWCFEFLTDKKWLGLDKNRLSVSVFEGDRDAARDEESANIWQSLGIPKERIFYLPKKDNWWGPAGDTGPCGPDTEMFYDTGKPPCSSGCKPGCKCGKYFEIWNDVFMEYNKTADGRYEKLGQKNVDTGMGVERTVAALAGKESVYEIETFKPIVDGIKKIAKIKSKPDKKRENEKQERSIRIITDHVRASTFILGDESPVVPSNVDHGYVLRRLIRRAIRHGKLLGIEKEFLAGLAEMVIDLNKKGYPNLEKKKESILSELKKEESKFRKTLDRGLKKFKQMTEGKRELNGRDAFLLFQSFGFPIEITKELGDESNIVVDVDGFEDEYRRHQELSRVGAEQKFKGGLSDASEQTTKLHTATHLLLAALRKVLKRMDVVQRGSNITPERLRFDFNFDRKLAKEELKAAEDLVNEQINRAVPVEKKEMSLEEAKALGAQGMFEDKYGKRVFVYIIGDFSIEICGGPHVKNTKELGKFKITKEESIAAGTRRIRAVLE